MTIERRQRRLKEGPQWLNQGPVKKAVLVWRRDQGTAGRRGFERGTLEFQKVPVCSC